MEPCRAHGGRLPGVLIALIVVLAACASSEGAESPTPTLPGTSTTATTATDATTVAGMTEAEANALVESLFAAYNAGDMDTWFLWRESGTGSPAVSDYLLAVGSSIDVEQCTYRGVGVWQVDGPDTGHGFDCEVTQTDDLLNAAGIALEMTYNWVIGADPESSQGGSNEDFRFVTEFMSEYRDWLAANHPEVEADLQYGPGIGLGLPVYPLPASVPTALDYIDEFVAESDVYPLTGPVPAGDYGGPLS